MRILPIASGKGGVGKSLVSVNLSIALAQAGKNVVLADLDLGGSNIHMFLGLRSIEEGIGTYLSNPKIQFDDIIVETEYKNLKFIPGDKEIPGLANLSYGLKQKLITQLKRLDCDFLVLDLGAGTNFNTVDFFLLSGRGIIVTQPTLVASLNAYLFLKNVIFRIMHSVFKKGSQAYKLLNGLEKEIKPIQKFHLRKFLSILLDKDPAGYEAYMKRAAKFNPRIIVNMLEDPEDGERSEKIRRSSAEYLDIGIEHLGIIYRDDLQDTALNARIPILKYKPNSILSQAIYRIADKIIHYEGSEDSPINVDSINTSFKTAEVEAEIDFRTKHEYIEELLHCGALTTGDLIETVKTQQFEINQLKNENQLLKSKLVKAIKQGFEN